MTEKVITVLLKKHPREEHLFLTHVERKENEFCTQQGISFKHDKNITFRAYFHSVFITSEV